MNWLDIVIAIIMVIAFLGGLASGLIKMVISFAGLVLGIFLAGQWYQALADKLTFISSEKAAAIVAYIVILLVVLAIAAIIARMLSKFISLIMLGCLNRLAGAVLGLFIAGIFIGAILAIWAKYGGGENVIVNSMLGRLLLDGFPLVLALLPGEFDTLKTLFK